MFLTNAPPNPVERTLLTTGTLAALFESSYEPNTTMYGRSNQFGMYLAKGRRISTPYLSITYKLSRKLMELVGNTIELNLKHQKIDEKYYLYNINPATFEIIVFY